jgi:hypothetical protein
VRTAVGHKEEDGDSSARPFHEPSPSYEKVLLGFQLEHSISALESWRSNTLQVHHENETAAVCMQQAAGLIRCVLSVE